MTSGAPWAPRSYPSRAPCPNTSTSPTGDGEWRRCTPPCARTAAPPQLRLVTFRAGKDRLFAEHPSSPVPEGRRATFQGLAYWRHDAALRFSARLEPDPRRRPGRAALGRRPGHAVHAGSAGSASPSRDAEQRLAVYWLNEYAGGIFIPFRDATSGSGDVRRRPLPVGLGEGCRPGLGRR